MNEFFGVGVAQDHPAEAQSGHSVGTLEQERTPSARGETEDEPKGACERNMRSPYAPLDFSGTDHLSIHRHIETQFEKRWFSGRIRRYCGRRLVGEILRRAPGWPRLLGWYQRIG